MPNTTKFPEMEFDQVKQTQGKYKPNMTALDTLKWGETK